MTKKNFLHKWKQLFSNDGFVGGVGVFFVFMSGLYMGALIVGLQNTPLW